VGETRDGVQLTNLDDPLFDGAGATKRDLVDYLDAVRDRILPVLRNRPLSVMRVRPGQAPFMQKNTPKYAPDWIATTTVWAQTSHREVAYPLCDGRRTLLWFANQRSVEFHPTLVEVGAEHPSHLVMDLDPPGDGSFDHVVRAARLVERVLAELGLAGAVKTSGAKGLHVFVPIATTAFIRDDRHGKVFLDPTRAGGATVVAAYSPRIRPGVPVSFPVTWAELDDVTPADFTVHTALERLGDADPWRERMPDPQPLPADLVAEGRTIPVPRVVAMHEGKRRKRAAGG
jgi:DNA ligase D-like protein (predicted polymerase)